MERLEDQAPCWNILCIGDGNDGAISEDFGVEEQKEMLVIISGSSGVGKNTIINEILKRDSRYTLLPTYTTREIRTGERPGFPYYFVSVDEFESMIQREELFEHQIVHDHYYGISKRKLYEMYRSSKILIKDIDVLGTLELLRKVDKRIKLLAFYYYVTSKEILIERLKNRCETNIELRLARYDMETNLSNQYDYQIENNNMENTLLLTQAIIQYEMCNDFLLPTQSIREIREDEIFQLAAQMRADKILPSIDVSIQNEKIFIIDGHHRYLASLLAGKRIAKRIVYPNHIDIVEYHSWEDIITHIEEKRGG
jgi:guanylate kinase